MDLNEFREYKKISKEIRENARVSKCLFSSFGGCSPEIIKAHSIQNNKILKKISKDGVVIGITASGDSFSTGGIDRIGRRIATTFSGFCSKHDIQIFSCIENKDYTPNDKEQEFTFAYRALCREIIAKEEERNTFEYILRKRKALITTMHGDSWIHAVEVALSDLKMIKDSFDKSLQEKDFGVIKTLLLELDGESKFAVSSIFHVECDFEGNIVNELLDINKKVKPLFLTVFPQNNKTYVLMSYLKEDSQVYRFLDTQILNLSRQDQTERLSLLITLYCENFAYSPEKWDSINKKSKEQFIELFTKTMFMEKITCMNLKPPINFFE